MTEQESINLVADFMGIKVAEWEIQHGGYVGMAKCNEDGDVDWQDGIDWYQPDKDWNQLMPVVQKCHEVGRQKQNDFPKNKGLDDPTGWRSWSYRHINLSTNIETVYRSVIKFIEWYNNSKQ